MTIEPVITKDGSLTFRMVELNEHYHSLNGAMRESEHVFINAGLRFCHDTFRQIKILEAGFGTGLNAFLSLIYAIENDIKIEYTGIELYPITKKLYTSLNYPDFYSDSYKPLFRHLHLSPWNQMKQINKVFDLIKLEKDLTNYHFPENTYHLIYYDAFSPQKQPGLWSEKIFTGIYRSLIRGGILVTYSSKGDVRRNLESSGFMVEKLQGPPGKRHMLRAVKNS